MPRIALAALVGGAAVFGSAPAAHAMAQATANSCDISLTDTHLDESHNVWVSSNGSCTSPSQFDSVVVELAFYQAGSRVVYTQTAVSRWAQTPATIEMPCMHGTWNYVATAWVDYHTAKHPATAIAVKVSESEDFPTTFSCK